MTENPRFRLPYDASKIGVEIMQGFNGPWSHREHSLTLDLTFAVDLVVPVGTPVLAAADGVVLFGYHNSETYYDGIDPKIGNHLPWGTNYLYIQHEGGIVSSYSHLAKESILVGIREKVSAGQVVAYTGLSGWVGPTPHLHFQAFRRSDYRSVPFVFLDYSGPLDHADLKKKLQF